MVQKHVIELLDDIDGSPATKTVQFGYEGIDYSIDLSEENADKLREALSDYIDSARRNGGGRKPAAAPAKSSGNKDLQAIRQWASENGHQVSARGRIASSIIDAYNEAH
ncbi:histone-like nucleoid-structuring protein Lsr2 [Naasia lichenicola]|uniref:Lsr2 family protein n=1 Tax=Naasia lichenicola TaxID=2565933 RepID=A0A4S4FNT0_9MICO|nr:Lsr2 family protein [Naasia lichenicola]THG30664.1 Lsr2 family protein [Naasia lichenicola]THG31901.1 Lsr2 family protein [Naasia lichenicola]